MDKKENLFLPPGGFENGFNIKTLVAALFIGFIMLPATIYLSLIAGLSLAGAAQWVTLLLFVEIAKRSFVQLKEQEIYIIFVVAGAVMAAVGTTMGTGDMGLQGGAFSTAIWNQYFIQSPYAKAFGLTNLPGWVVPPAGSAALVQRNFFNHAWLTPFFVIIIHELLFRINRFTLGYAFFRITSDRERLEFPIASVASEGVMALADSSAKKDTKRVRVFTTGAMIGMIYAAFYVFIPTFTGLVMSKPFTLIPIPFVDLTSQIGSIFPASIFGFVTDLSAVFIGFVLPFWAALGTFVGSIGAQTIANPLLYRHTDFLKTWQPGMSAVPAYVSAAVDFWVSVGIGMGIVILILGIAIVFRIKRREKTSGAKLPEGRGDYPLSQAFGIWAVSTILYVILCHRLVPAFPVWLFFAYGLIFTPALTYISARMFGITGMFNQVSFSYIREGTIILSGYKGADIWFAPVPFFSHGDTVQAFKQAELTRTRFTSWYKAEFMAFGIMLFCSFLFWAIIWKMGPIPASTYPFVQRMWPMYAIQKALWSSSTIPGGAHWLLGAVKPGIIAWSTVGGLGLAGILGILKFPVTFFYGIIGGVNFLPHYGVSVFIGAILGQFVFARRLGVKEWRSMTPLLLAGYGCGVGLVGAASVAVALIAKTVFQLVY